MWGASHPGEVQWLAAVGRPPGLLAIAPIAASSSLYHIIYQGGALRLALLAAGAALRVNPPPEGVNRFVSFYESRMIVAAEMNPLALLAENPTLLDWQSSTAYANVESVWRKRQRSLRAISKRATV